MIVISLQNLIEPPRTVFQVPQSRIFPLETRKLPRQVVDRLAPLSVDGLAGADDSLDRRQQLKRVAHERRTIRGEDRVVQRVGVQLRRRFRPTQFPGDRLGVVMQFQRSLRSSPSPADRRDCHARRVGLQDFHWPDWTAVHSIARAAW